MGMSQMSQELAQQRRLESSRQPERGLERGPFLVKGDHVDGALEARGRCRGLLEPSRSQRHSEIVGAMLISIIYF